MPEATHGADLQKARDAFNRRFDDAPDPDEARRRYFAELGRKSGQARRERSEQVAELLDRTRTKRGMTLVITDPAIIAKVAGIVAAPSTGGEAA